MNTIHSIIKTSLNLIKSSFYLVVVCTSGLGFSELMAQEKEYTVLYHENGRVSSEGYMLDDKPDGFWKTYYPDGTIKSEGKRTQFELDSIWNFYNHNGLKTSSLTYRKGDRNGEATYYDAEENIKEIANYENGVKQGEALYFYSTGEVSKKVDFVDGKESGQAFEYGKDQRIITLLRYENGFITRQEEINRYDLQGRKSGRWIEYHRNGNIAVEGNYTSGLKNGFFKSFDSRANLLLLEKYENGRLVEDAEEIKVLDIQNTFYPDGSVRSTGGYNKDGLREGVHRIYDSQGSIISGNMYNNGILVAEGITDREGYYQGFWKHYYPTGELKSEGSYINSERDGPWVFYYMMGGVEQKGNYVAGLPHSQWNWYYENGEVLREEYYRRGFEDGESIEYNSQGEEITKGEYGNGSKEGEWFYSLGDHTEKGSYLADERHGLWKYFYHDGKLYFEGEYMGGLPVGRHRYYYPSGQLRQDGRYNSGIKVGTWKVYNEEGMRELTIRYKKGVEFRINGARVEDGSQENEDLDEWTPLEN